MQIQNTYKNIYTKYKIHIQIQIQIQYNYTKYKIQNTNTITYTNTNLVGKVDQVLLLLKTGFCHRGQGHEKLANQVGFVGEDKVRADVHQPVGRVLLRHHRDLQDVLLAQLLAKERGQGHLEILHQVEVGHGQKTFGIIAAQLLWYADPIDEVNGGGKHLGRRDISPPQKVQYICQNVVLATIANVAIMTWADIIFLHHRMYNISAKM